MGKTFKHGFEHVRIPMAPPTKVLQSRVQSIRALNYLLDSNYNDEEEDLEPFWLREEVHING